MTSSIDHMQQFRDNLARWLLDIKDKRIVADSLQVYCFSTPFPFRITRVEVSNSGSEPVSFPSIRIELDHSPFTCTLFYSRHQEKFIANHFNGHIFIPLASHFPSPPTYCPTEIQENMNSTREPFQLILFNDNNTVRREYSSRMMDWLISLRTEPPTKIILHGQPFQFRFHNVHNDVSLPFPTIQIMCLDGEYANTIIACEYNPYSHRFIPYHANECMNYWDLQQLIPSYTYILYKLEEQQSDSKKMSFYDVWSTAMKQVKQLDVPNVGSGYQTNKECSSNVCYKCDSSNCREVKSHRWRSELSAWLSHCQEKKINLKITITTTATTTINNNNISRPSVFSGVIFNTAEDINNTAPTICMKLTSCGDTTPTNPILVPMLYNSTRHSYVPFKEEHSNYGELDLMSSGFPIWYHHIHLKYPCYKVSSPPSTPRRHDKKGKSKRSSSGMKEAGEEGEEEECMFIINPLLLAPRKKKKSKIIEN